MLLGLTFAILASLGSGAGSAVEAFGVRKAAAKGKPAGDLGPLLHEPIYFIGLTVDLLGFVFTVIALQFGSLLTGAIITEQIFSWPGLGRLLLTSISNRDYPQVQASILVIALTYILVNFASDLLYGVVDPRIKLE